MRRRWLAVTYERGDQVSGSEALQLVEPALHRVEGVPAADVVGDHGPVSAAVVALCDGAEALLPRRVPHLHLHTHTHTDHSSERHQTHLCAHHTHQRQRATPAHCILNTEYCTLYTKHYILRTKHCMLNTVHYILPTKLHTEHCILSTEHCTLHTAYTKHTAY